MVVPFATVSNIEMFGIDAGVIWITGSACVADTYQTIDRHITTIR
jgi:hypothetical protein